MNNNENYREEFNKTSINVLEKYYDINIDNKEDYSFNELIDLVYNKIIQKTSSEHYIEETNNKNDSHLLYKVNIICILEKILNIEISDEEIDNILFINDLCNLIEEKIPFKELPKWEKINSLPNIRNNE